MTDPRERLRWEVGFVLLFTALFMLGATSAWANGGPEVAAFYQDGYQNGCVVVDGEGFTPGADLEVTFWDRHGTVHHTVVVAADEDGKFHLDWCLGSYPWYGPGGVTVTEVATGLSASGPLRLPLPPVPPDIPECPADPFLVYGTPGDDPRLAGTRCDDVIWGDTDAALVGTVAGGNAEGGDDTIFGYSGDDLIYGDAGTLISGEMACTWVPGERRRGGHLECDIAWGSGGDDIIDTGTGDDTIYGDAPVIDEFGVGGDDTINGSHGDDTIYGDAEELGSGSLFPPAPGGIGGDDTITGGEGDDTIYGDAQDLGHGSFSGDDTITGGNGDDHLWGDGDGGWLAFSGDDEFVYDLSGVPQGDDIIYDFERSGWISQGDTLVLTGVADLNGGGVDVTDLDNPASGHTVATVGDDVVLDLNGGADSVTLLDVASRRFTPTSWAELDDRVDLEIQPV